MLADRHPSFDDERFVEFDEVFDPTVYEQVAAYGDFGGGESGLVELDVHERRVEYYVAVVGEEEVSAVGVEPVDAARREPVGRGLY